MHLLIQRAPGRCSGGHLVPQGFGDASVSRKRPGALAAAADGLLLPMATTATVFMASLLWANIPPRITMDIFQYSSM